MVLTRRQNGVTPNPSSALKRSLEAAEASENEYNTEDDYEESKVVKAPSAKRRKTAQAATSKASSSTAKAVAKPKRRGKDLSLLPTMPLDVLFEILGQLGPKDLLSLSRTNKLWRSTVVSPETEFLWRDAREAFRAPEPPEDFTEQRWAGLLFETTCESCGRKGTKVDWLLLRRACVACKRKHLMYAPKFKGTFPGEDKDVLNYVPHTHTGVSTRHYGRWGAKQSKFYWVDDIQSAIEEMSELRGKALEEWKADRTEDIEDRANMVSEYKKWTNHMDLLSWDDARSNRTARLKAATQRFVEAGYELIDIEKAINASSEGIYTGVPHITNAVWTKIRPELEQCVIKVRNKRLAAELQPAVEKRMKILSKVYDDYLDLNFRPSERYYCPPVEVFRPIPEVMALVEADMVTTITAQDFQPIVEKFGQYIDDYQETKKKSFEALVPPAAQSQTDRPSFDLAQNIFRREADRPYYYSHRDGKPEDDVLVGWPMLGTHRSSGRSRLEVRPGVHLDMPESFGYNMPGSQCSSKLITLAGLDPATATVEDMDAADQRFVFEDFSTAIGYPVFTWRGAIIIDSKGDRYSYATQNFRLATSDEEAEAKANEDALRGTAEAWSCNHCTTFLESGMATRAVLITHIQDEHGITDPQPIENYFMNERCRHTFEKPYEILVPDVQKYKCKCQSCALYGNRAFSKEQLDVHLKTAYSYRWSPPVEGTDYWPIPSGRDARATATALEDDLESLFQSGLFSESEQSSDSE